MTFLKKILKFNIPIKEIECGCCKGTGKQKTEKSDGLTRIISMLLGLFSVMAFLSLLSEPSIIEIISSIILFPIIILAVIEYRQQTA